MVLSVVAVGVAMGATVQRGSSGPNVDTPEFDPGVGGPSTVVVDETKPVVFQGEDDIDFVRENGNDIQASQLIGVSGDAEGQPLELPIPQDQPPGQYAINGQAANPGVTVQRPRVTELELLNERGVDVAGASVQEDETLLVRSQWNFREAEDLEIIVRDENGNEVTGDVLTNAQALTESQRQELDGLYARNTSLLSVQAQEGDGTGSVYLQGVGQINDSQLQSAAQVDSAYYALDFSEQDSGSFTVTVQGWDNLDFGPASRTTSINVTTEDDVSLLLGSENATRGERVGYTIEGSSAGATHYVAIEREDFRNNQVNADVFRSIQDVVDRGTVDTNNDDQADFAYAQVEIDEDTGLGIGQIDTAFLDDASVPVNLYGADQNLSEVAADLGDTEDEETLDVSQGELQFENPAGTYISGAEEDVSGFAAPGVDDVAIYARDQGDWELVDINTDGQLTSEDTISVDSTGEWEREDVVLSEASDIFSIPGRYRIGVVEAQDAASNGNLSNSLTTSEFSSATSSQSTLIVQEPGLNDSRTFRTINEQIAVEDGTVDVRGSAPGLDEVLVVMVDSRGRVATDRVAVDDDDTFDEDDIPLVTPDGRSLSEGEIRGVVLGLGRDGSAGDGILPGAERAGLSALEDYITNLGTGLTQQQVIERIKDETTEEVASDDLSLEQSFRYTDGSVSITSVRPAGENVTGVQEIAVGEEMEVVGQTNRQPDDNTISVEVVSGPSADDFDSASTDDWGLQGAWNVSLSTDNVEPGTYTIEVDDGDNTDTVQVEIVEADAGGDNATATPTANTTATPEQTATPTANETG